MSKSLNGAQLENVLSMLCQSNTSVIKEGEKILKAALKSPKFILNLLAQIKTCGREEIRMHAALFMKKKLVSHYPKLNAASQNSLKVELVSALLHENVKQVCVAVIGCVATLAKAVFSIGQEWPELFQTVMQLLQSANELHRFLSFNLLEQVCFYFCHP